MLGHLWVKAPPPPEYIDFVLCDRFGWTPAELRQQRATDILNILTILDVQGKVNKLRKGK